MRTIALTAAVALLTSAAAAPARAGQHTDAAEDEVGALGSGQGAELTALPPSPDDEQAGDRRWLALGALGGVYVGFGTWAYYAWYKDHPKNHGFVLGGDGLFERNSYAGGADKLGHAWATMALARGSSQALRYGGWDRKRAALIGGGLSALAFTLVEYQDAYYYEFSLGDLGADYLGAALAILLESSPRADELLDFRVEYWPSPEYRSILRGDPGRDPSLDLKKINVAEDYSGQTYLLALHLSAFDDLEATPLRYVDAVVGFRTNKYRPVPLPDDVSPPTQHLFVGASLNLQAVVDRVLEGGGQTRRGVRTVLHGMTEVANAPFTSHGVGSERSCAPPACMPAP